MTSESKPVRGNTWNKPRLRLAVFDHRYDQIGFRISLHSSLVTNDPLDTCPDTGEAMSLPSLTTPIRPHHHAE